MLPARQKSVPDITFDDRGIRISAAVVRYSAVSIKTALGAANATLNSFVFRSLKCVADSQERIAKTNLSTMPVIPEDRTT